MRNKKRPFHLLDPEHLFVFHIRGDMEPRRKGEIGHDVKLLGSRAATVVVAMKAGMMSYGVGRCQFAFPFARKLGRAVATGRAKQALFSLLEIPQNKWPEQGVVPWVAEPAGDKGPYNQARALAILVIKRISEHWEREFKASED